MEPIKKPTIIWADDDTDDLWMVQEVLKEYSQEINLQEAHNGRQVLHLLDETCPENFPCLIILDINMPILDGKTTFGQIKDHEAYRQIPVVIFTTSTNEKEKDYFSRMGAEVLTKPSSFSEFRDTVFRMISLCVH
jgi:CheY-like chemotaxis protein